MTEMDAALMARSGGSCELCGSGDEIAPYDIGADPATHASGQLAACGVCRDQIDGELDADGEHWRCLREAIWSEVPAVQVASWRLLNRLSAQPWARDVLDQAYLDDALVAWASAGLGGDDGDAAAAPTLDSNGTALKDGDSVTLIKDLDVKGTSFVAKRGTLVKNIRLTDNPEHVEGKVNKVAIVLVAAYLKKSG